MADRNGMHRAAAKATAIGSLVLALAAGAGEPYSVIDVTDWKRTEPHAVPVQIASIDGKDYLRETRRVLAPGKHRIEFLSSRATRANPTRERKAVELDLKPCTTYYFYAQHASKYDEAWELKVLRETTIEACSR